jgi:exosortase A-associated hydrolase 2
MNEVPLFLEREGERLFAVHHRPAVPGHRAVVICHPLAEEKLWSHRVLVSFARDLAGAGFDVLRFDSRGEGDSDRQFEDSDFESRVSDTEFATETLRGLAPGTTDLTLVGLRLGASVAAAAASGRGDVTRLILWDPVVDGSAYMQHFLRLNLMAQMAAHRRVVEDREALAARIRGGGSINIEGYALTGALFEQVSRFRLADALPSFGGEMLLVQIDAADAPLKPELAALTETHPRRSVVQIREETFWKEGRAFCQHAPELNRVSLEALGVYR